MHDAQGRSRVQGSGGWNDRLPESSGEFLRLYARWFMEAIPPRGVALNMPMSQALRNKPRERSDQPAS